MLTKLSLSYTTSVRPTTAFNIHVFTGLIFSDIERQEKVSKRKGFKVSHIQVHILTLPLIRYIALGKLLILLEPQFPHL